MSLIVPPKARRISRNSPSEPDEGAPAGGPTGPSAAGLVQSPERVALLAEIGVVLLLFTIGLEFSLDR